ncbi:hypothetical protein PMI36_05779 [Pseudomonas sp. GM79]|nr:hypothetical protein PMI36_05779 [Pseudomonas sp. GM79]
MWRGSLLPLGREAAPSSQATRISRFYDCCAAEREQAPSPQMKKATCKGRIFLCLKVYTAALRRVAMNAAAPMNSPANVRFMRFCCLGVRNKRSTFAASPV